MGEAVPPLNGIRVLVVENEVKIRDLHAELLKSWGYQPVIAQGIGSDLLRHARELAETWRCQIALIDMRLLDDHDSRDHSGLELAPQLRPAEPVIVSGHGDLDAARAAFKKFEVFDFVAKHRGPEGLRQVLAAVERKLGLDKDGPKVIWSDGLTSRDICRQLFPNQPGVPADAADELIKRLVPDARRVMLTLINGDGIGVQVSGLRRSSRVFRALVNEEQALRVIKLARVRKIEQELENFKTYVEHQFQGQFVPRLLATTRSWDLGAVAYSYVANTGFRTNGGPQTLTDTVRQATSATQVLPAIGHFFADSNWGNWYNRDVTVLRQSLVEAYDATWRGVLAQQLGGWKRQPARQPYSALNISLPNPRRWLAEHHAACHDVWVPRQAVTHGDLHGDNLFVDRDHAWPVDFERTGPGPILRDFVELIQDLLTRMARFPLTDLPLFYELAVALCRPTDPDEPMLATPAISNHPESHTIFETLQALQLLAHERTHYKDRREYLWGLLLNNLFVITQLDKHNPRCTPTLLLASLICARLERWNLETWPPASWEW